MLPPSSLPSPITVGPSAAAGAGVGAAAAAVAADVAAAAEGPRFSVIVPTFHRLDLLANCLAHLAPGAQLLEAGRYEVIVTDDGTAPTAETLVKTEFPWARWTAGPRRGPAANRNHGSSLATGSWLVFTDDDCVPDPGWLAAIAGAIRSGQDERVIEGRTKSEATWKGPLWCAPTNEGGGFLWSCNFAIERAFFQELGGFDADFPYAHLEDVDLRLRIAARRVPMRFVPAALVVHPQRPLSGIWRSVLVHESCFQLSAKHGLPLRESGVSWRHLVRVKVRNLLASPSLGQAWRYGCRSVAEAVLVVVFSPWWTWKYSGRRAPARSATPGDAPHGGGGKHGHPSVGQAGLS